MSDTFEKRPRALVTGGNRGIGNAVAKALSADGFDVILTARSATDAHAAAAALTGHTDHSCAGYALEVTDPASVDRLVAALAQDKNPITVLVNNAGAHFDISDDVLSPDLDIATAAFNTNVLGTWRMTTSIVPLMSTDGSARIVNMSSDMGALGLGYPGAPGYSASRAAVNMLTIKLAHALVDHRILVNAASPGHVRTHQGGPDAPRSVEEGAQTLLHCVRLPNDGPTGQFFRDSQAAAW